jgi:hypothetical protein
MRVGRRCQLTGAGLVRARAALVCDGQASFVWPQRSLNWRQVSVGRNSGWWALEGDPRLKANSSRYVKASSPKRWRDWSPGEVGAKKYNPEGVQSMQCKGLCSASVMRYGDSAGRCTTRRRNVMPQTVDDGCRARVFESYTMRQQCRVTQDTTTRRLSGES